MFSILGFKIEASGAAATHQSAQLGIYELTRETVRNYPVYKHSCLDEYLFVGPNGYWRVGPDTSTFKGTHFKNPKKPTPVSGVVPPRTGWQYWNEEWLDDNTIRVGRAGSGEINQFGLNCALAFDEALICLLYTSPSPRDS